MANRKDDYWCGGMVDAKNITQHSMWEKSVGNPMIADNRWNSGESLDAACLIYEQLCTQPTAKGQV